MPIHTFECEFCGHIFEELIMREADEAELVCPSCGATRPKRRMSVTARCGSGGGGGAPFAGMPPSGCGGGGG